MTQPIIDDVLELLIRMYDQGMRFIGKGDRIDKRIEQLQRVILQRVAEHSAPIAKKKKRKKGGQ